jgi:flagellar hook-associated protein 1
MTTLSSALSQALSGLRVSSAQSAIAARNISRANEEDYSRKYAVLTTDIDGSARIESYTRSAEKKLLDAHNTSLSDASSQRTVLAALEKLQETAGDVSDEMSLASQIGRLQDRLKASEANPGDQSLASATVRTAATLAQKMNDVAANIQSVRSEADSGLKASITNINAFLTQIEDINARITKSGTSDQDVAEALDARDKILKSLASEVGIRTVAQENNGIAVYTDGGVTLFNQVARKVTFAPSPSLSAAGNGNAVYADGVPIVGPGAQMPSRTGKMAGLAEIRDKIAPQFQAQVDEVARGMIVAFAERDQSLPPTQPDATGLFTFPGSPSVPAAATVVPGLSSVISVSAGFDPLQGGNPMLLRDGGANGIAYRYNTSGESGYQDRISSLISAIDGTMTFASGTGLNASSGLTMFAAESSGWLEGLRADVHDRSRYSDAMETRAKDALARRTGVNIDDEMSAMLNLERSYQASAKVMNIVDTMFNSLLEAVR